MTKTRNSVNNYSLVSVVIPFFNRERMILSTLESVVAQTYRPIELILIDDGSTDNGLSLVKNWASTFDEKDFKVVIKHQLNKGAPVARNIGMNLAKGDYIQFLDSDDFLAPQKIENQVEALIDSQADLAICDFQRVCVHDTIPNRIRLNNGNLYDRLKKGHSVSIFTPLITSNTLKKSFVSWDEGLRSQQDKDFMLKLMLMTDNYIYTPGVWCSYIEHNNSQISDSYQLKAPQFTRRIYMLVVYITERWRYIPNERKSIIIPSLVDIFLRGVRFYLILLLHFLIGKNNAKRIKQYLIK